MALPANVGTCLVTGTFIRAVIDSVDADRDPDGVPIEGLTVKFTASVPMVRNASAVPPVMVFMDPIICTTDASGALIGLDGQPGIRLVASNDPDLDPSGWTYRAELSAPTLPKFSFSFVAPAGGTVDLSTVVPVPPSPGDELVAWQVAVTTTEAARDVAVIAAADADAARDEAVIVAAGIPTTNDPIVAALINDPASETGAALVATYARKDAQVSVKDYGATGDGTTDDTTAIQAAINAVGTAGGGRVWFPAGTYVTSATLTVTADGVSLAGSQSAVIEPDLGSLGVGISATGTRTADVTTVTVAAVKGARTITTAEPLTAGDVIVIRSEVEDFNTDRDYYKKSEIATIASVLGSVATLTTGLRDSYDPGVGTVRVDRLTMLDGFEVSGLTVRMGGTGLAQTGIRAAYARGVRIEGVKAVRGARSNIATSVCVDVLIADSHVEDADEAGLAYGIWVSGSTNVAIVGNTGRRNRHSIEVSCYTPEPISRDVTITGNSVTEDVSAGISTHGGTDNVTVSANSVSMCGGGIVLRGAATTVTGNTIITAPNGSAESYRSPMFIGDNGVHDWGDGRAGDHLIVTNNRLIYEAGGDTTAIPAMQITAPLLNAVISDNVFAGFTSHGIYAQGNLNDGVIISGNIFDGDAQPGGEAGRYAILIIPRTVSATSHTSNLHVTNNQFLNLSNGPLTITGPTAVGAPSSGIRFLNNHVESPSHCVRLESGGYFANVYVAGNTLSGGVTSPVTANGTLNNAAVTLNNIVSGAAPANTWAARQTFSVAPALANNVSLLALESGGATVSLAQVTTGDVIYFGGTGNRATVFRTGSGEKLRFRAGSTDSIIVGDATVGFYNVTPVARQTVAAAATDAATTQSLVNDLRSKLIALGLVQ